VIGWGLSCGNRDSLGWGRRKSFRRGVHTQVDDLFRSVHKLS
jgi:hypothetical protein